MADRAIRQIAKERERERETGSGERTDCNSCVNLVSQRGQEVEEGSPSVRPSVCTSVRPTDRALCFESKYFLTSGSQMSYTVCAEYALRTPKCRPSQLLLDMHTQSQSHNQRRTGKESEAERESESETGSNK